MPTAKPVKTKDFRGLTIFELLIILIAIGAAIFWGVSTKKDLRNQLNDSIRKGRVSAFNESLRSYVLENGSFPSEEQYYDEAKRKEIFSRFLLDEGENALQDPTDNSILIDYAPSPEGCAPDTEILCESVSLGMYLTNGEDFTRFAVKPGKEAELLLEESNNDVDNLIPDSLEIE
jgi:hypothetical protein